MYLLLQLEDINVQLESESDEKDRLTTESRLLRHELGSLRSVEKSYTKMEKAKRKLEQDLQYYRVSLGVNVCV